MCDAHAEAGTPTCGKPSPEENVEELLGGNVGFEVSVEGPIVTRAAASGLFGGAERCRLISVLVVLLPLLGVAQHGVSVADCCGEVSRGSVRSLQRLWVALSSTRLVPLNASVAPGAKFLSG